MLKLQLASLASFGLPLLYVSRGLTVLRSALFVFAAVVTLLLALVCLCFVRAFLTVERHLISVSGYNMPTWYDKRVVRMGDLVDEVIPVVTVKHSVVSFKRETWDYTTLKWHDLRKLAKCFDYTVRTKAQALSVLSRYPRHIVKAFWLSL